MRHSAGITLEMYFLYCMCCRCASSGKETTVTGIMQCLMRCYRSEAQPDVVASNVRIPVQDPVCIPAETLLLREPPTPVGSVGGQLGPYIKTETIRKIGLRIGKLNLWMKEF